MTSNSPEKYNWPIYVEKEKYNITINRKPIATTAIFLSLIKFSNNFFNNSFTETKVTILKCTIQWFQYVHGVLKPAP